MNILIATLLFSQVLIDQYRFPIETTPPPSGNGLLNDLQAYWNCDDAEFADFNDSTSNNRDLTSEGSVGTDTGALNTSRTFISNEDGMYVDEAWNSIESGESFTFTCWVYFDFLPDPGQPKYTIMSKGTISETKLHHDYILRAEYEPDGDKAFYAEFGGVGLSVVPSPDLTTGQWYFVAVRYTAGTASISYVNGGGLVHSSFTAVGNPADGISESFRLGAAADPIEERDLNGARLDEVSFYKKVLTDEQIFILYNGGTPLPYSSFTL